MDDEEEEEEKFHSVSTVKIPEDTFIEFKPNQSSSFDFNHVPLIYLAT